MVEHVFSTVAEGVPRHFPIPVVQVPATRSGHPDSQFPQGPLYQLQVALLGKHGPWLDKGEVEVAPIVIHCPSSGDPPKQGRILVLDTLVAHLHPGILVLPDDEGSFVHVEE